MFKSISAIWSTIFLGGFCAIAILLRICYGSDILGYLDWLSTSSTTFGQKEGLYNSLCMLMLLQLISSNKCANDCGTRLGQKPNNSRDCLGFRASISKCGHDFLQNESLTQAWADGLHTFSKFNGRSMTMKGWTNHHRFQVALLLRQTLEELYLGEELDDGFFLRAGRLEHCISLQCHCIKSTSTNCNDHLLFTPRPFGDHVICCACLVAWLLFLITGPWHLMTPTKPSSRRLALAVPPQHYWWGWCSPLWIVLPPNSTGGNLQI